MTVQSFRSVSLLLVALAPLAPVIAAGPAQGERSARADAVRVTIGEITAAAGRLEADVGRAERTVASPPRLFSRRLEALQFRLDDALNGLRGLHWTVADPALDEARQLHARLAALGDRLDDWQPTLPPDPNRPLKISTATGTGAISGTLTDETTGQPIPYTRVRVYCPDHGGQGEARSDTQGHYIVEGLDSGAYFVWTENELAYVNEVYDDVACSTECVRTEGTPVPVVDGEVTAGIDFALTRTAEIHGRITDVATGDPLEGIQVDLFEVDGSWLRNGIAGADGRYGFSVLAPGTYFVKTSDDRYLDEVYDDVVCAGPQCDPTSGLPVAIASGEYAGGVDFQLQVGGRILGTVVEAATGLPLWDIRLSVFGSTGAFLGEGMSDHETGEYALGHLPTGSYYVKAEDHFRFADQLYNGIRCQPDCDAATGTAVSVTVGLDTRRINFSLEPLPGIRGSITDEQTGLPLAGVFLTVFDDNGEFVDWTVTNPAGEYRRGLEQAGTYFVVAEEDVYVKEVFKGIKCGYFCRPIVGTPVTVDWGHDTPNVDFSLTRLGGIAGYVRDAATGDPVAAPNLGVYFFDSSGRDSVNSGAAAFGFFSFENVLPPGVYFAWAAGSVKYLPQLYDGILATFGTDFTTGTPIVVTAGQTTLVEFSLVRAGTISGTVTDSTTGHTLSGIRVSVHNPAGKEVSNCRTAETGSYTCPGLLPGSYFVEAQDWWGKYVSEVYKDFMCLSESCDPTVGMLVPVGIATDTPGIDFALTPAGTITGTVKNSVTGSPVPSIFVGLFDGEGNFLDDEETGSDGGFRFRGLLTGTYYAIANGDWHDDYWFFSELFKGLPCAEGRCDPEGGTPIIVTLGYPTEGVDFLLEPRPVFADLPVTHWAWRWVDALMSIGRGGFECATDPLRFCPNAPLSRKEAALFLLASSQETTSSSSDVTGVFSDLPPGDRFTPWVEELVARGIATGCGGGKFCPDDPVSRGEMARFLLKTLEGPLYAPPPAAGILPDVPVDDPLAPWIEELVNRGISTGCCGPGFCPGEAVTRAEAAGLLVKTFDLADPVPGPLTLPCPGAARPSGGRAVPAGR